MHQRMRPHWFLLISPTVADGAHKSCSPTQPKTRLPELSSSVIPPERRWLCRSITRQATVSAIRFQRGVRRSCNSPERGSRLLLVLCASCLRPILLHHLGLLSSRFAAVERSSRRPPFRRSRPRTVFVSTRKPPEISKPAQSDRFKQVLPSQTRRRTQRL